MYCVHWDGAPNKQCAEQQATKREFEAKKGSRGRSPDSQPTLAVGFLD